jgi:hypothetical protein
MRKAIVIVVALLLAPHAASRRRRRPTASFGSISRGTVETDWNALHRCRGGPTVR